MSTRAAPPYTPPLSVSHPAMLVDGSDESFRHVLYLMVLASARLGMFREAVGRTLGLTSKQYLVLLGTAHRQGTTGVTIRDLAQYILMASTHVTTQVGALIRKGLLKKRPNGKDGRSVLVSLTAKGERAMDAIAPMRREFNDAFFVGIERGSLLSVARFLQQVADNSERALPILSAFAGAQPGERADGDKNAQQLQRRHRMPEKNPRQREQRDRLEVERRSARRR